MKHCYGYRRVHSELRKRGWEGNHKLVYKLMDQMGLKSKVRSRKKYNSYQGQTSHIAENLLDRNFESVGGVQSMSRKGNCYDNAVMENFFGHLETEMHYGEYFTSVDELYRAVDDYIFWYNNARLQNRFKGLTPTQYRNQTLETLTT